MVQSSLGRVSGVGSPNGSWGVQGVPPISLLRCLTPDVWLRNSEGFSWI